MTSSMDYTDKIAKLLAKAEGTDNPNEAETFRAHAYKLMVKHAITEAELAAHRQGSEAPSEEIVTLRVPLFGIYRDALLVVCHAATLAFRTLNGYAIKNTVPSVYDRSLRNSGKGHIYLLVGFQSEAERVKRLLDSLVLQALGEMNRWWKRHPDAEYLRLIHNKDEQFRDRREFVYSFGEGVAAKIKSTLVEAVAESTSTGTELVLRDRRQLVDSWMRKHTNTRTSRSRAYAGSATAGAAGYQSGLRSDIGQTAVRR